MSNAAHFYWAKLQRAGNMFQEQKTEGVLDKVQDICCQLVNEVQCPRLCQIEAWKLRSQCYPDNYWFAKAQLEHALEVVDKCAEDENADDYSLAGLRKSEGSVEAMLEDRTSKYQAEWKAKGRDIAPSEDEWYEIVESEPNENGAIFEFIGQPFRASDWPFEAQAVDASVLKDKTFPPLFKVGPVQQQQHDDEQEVGTSDLVMRDTAERTGETAQKRRRLVT